MVVLGDSYSAGNGARNPADERSYSGVAGCMRSAHNWASQFRRLLKASGLRVSYVNHACSGSQSEDLSAPNEMNYEVTMDAPAGVDTDAEVLPWVNSTKRCQTGNYLKEQYWLSATNGDYDNPLFGGPEITFTCQRRLLPQRLFVGPQTDLVAMTLGGNDIGFSNIIRHCFGPRGFGRDHDQCEVDLAEADRDLPDVEDAIRAQVEGLFGPGRLSSSGRVVLVGYPLLSMAGHRFMANDTDASLAVRRLGVEGEAMLRDLVADINSDPASPASGKVTFVPGIPARFAGHEPDPDLNRRNPERWLWEFRDFWAAGTEEAILEYYHANPEGLREYAAHVHTAAVGGAGVFGAGVNRKPTGDVDVVLTVDVSASMDGELARLRSQVGRILDGAKSRANTVRFALVSFREDPRFSGDPIDFTSRVEHDFTDDPAAIVAAVQSLEAAGGGGAYETMLSGLMSGLELDWRTGVKRSLVVVSDNWPHTPEQFTDISLKDVIDKAWAEAPAAISIVDTGNVVEDAGARRLVEETAGAFYDAASDDVVDAALEDAVNGTLDRPHAWINDAYVGKPGAIFEIDGSGSYASDGEIVSYGWDFDGDRVPDQTTATPEVVHTFDNEVTGEVGLHVTDQNGRVAIATAPLAITVDGDEVPTAIDNCPAVDNMGQIDTDQDGIGDACDPTGPTIPDDPHNTRPPKARRAADPGSGPDHGPGRVVRTRRAHLPMAHRRRPDPGRDDQYLHGARGRRRAQDRRRTGHQGR